MTSKDFYSRESYRQKQSLLTKLNWKKGVFNFTIKNEKRVCIRKGCVKEFIVKPSDPKLYCSRRCSALVNNAGRILSSITKAKISKTLTGRTYPERQGITYVDVVCNNADAKRYLRNSHGNVLNTAVTSAQC